MLLAYLDESYSADFYSIGAVVADPEAWEEIEHGLAEVVAYAAATYGTDPAAELHGHELMGGSGGWKALRGKHREAADVYLRAVRVLRASSASILFRGVDVVRLNARYKYPALPHGVVLGHLLERIDDEAARRGAPHDSVIVLCDQVGTQIEHRREFSMFRAGGTPGYRPSQLRHLSEPLNFVDSSAVLGVQAADLVTYLYRRREVVPVERHRAAQRTMNQLWHTMSPLIRHRWVWLP